MAMERGFEGFVAPDALVHGADTAGMGGILDCILRREVLRRYAGRAFDSEKDVGGPGTLMVKGLKSMWRQAPPIVRNTLQGVLTRIIMQVMICALTCSMRGLTCDGLEFAPDHHTSSALRALISQFSL